MRTLEVAAVGAGYGTGPDVLSDADLDVERGEVVALLGASGSGKSTLLRCIAGLHPIRRGRIMLDGTDVHDVAVERRGIGLVFQDHALFPHRDVADNVAFGPRMQGLDRRATLDRVDRALADVGLTALARRAVDELSGGEQQRVALARALAADPRLLLLDEPYGSLDRPLRERLASELPALVRTQDVAAILVTHDQQEALRAADRIAVIIAGRVRQLDRPERLWHDPADADVAAFLGVGVLVRARSHGDRAEGTFGTLPVPHAGTGTVRLLIPHRALSLVDPDDGSRPGELRATVTEVRFAGDHHRVEARLLGGEAVTVRISGGAPDLAVGEPVRLAVDTSALRSYPDPDADAPAGPVA